MSIIKDYNEELYHYGVKGMKWGVRRAKRLKSVYSNKAEKQIDINTKATKVADKLVRTGRGADNRRLTDNDIKDIKKERERYVKAAKEWISARDDIMSMNVSTFTAKDIKQRYKNARSSAGGIYVVT